MNAKIVLLAFALSVFTVSCKKDKPSDTPVEEPVVVTGLKIVSDSTKVNWTAYKTTEKVAVGGSFTQIEVKNLNEGNDLVSVLNGASFSIPVSSVFTNNPERDGKLKEFFFGALKDTEFIGGVINFTDDKASLTLTLNNVTNTLAVNHAISGNKISFEGILNLEDFGGDIAIESLNKVCHDLHKGADGVSKTWSEVAISGSVLFE